MVSSALHIITIARQTAMLTLQYGTSKRPNSHTSIPVLSAMTLSSADVETAGGRSPVSEMLALSEATADTTCSQCSTSCLRWRSSSFAAPCEVESSGHTNTECVQWRVNTSVRVRTLKGQPSVAIGQTTWR